MRSSAAADNAATQASRISAQLHADVSYLYDAVRHHQPHVILVAVLIAAVWWGGRRLRHYYGNRWISNHLRFTVIPSPATDFTPHRPGRRSLTGRPLRGSKASVASTAGEIRVVRIQVVARTTTASCTELVS